jgi:trehalose-phosphatase
LILRRTNGGVELRAAGRTKGAAVRELLESAPETTLPLYVGDDETDEDVFREIRGSGLAVWVGSSRNAAAPGWLQSCAGVRAFLQELERVIDGA